MKLKREDVFSPLKKESIASFFLMLVQKEMNPRKKKIGKEKDGRKGGSRFGQVVVRIGDNLDNKRESFYGSIHPNIWANSPKICLCR
jgi:hypothetical protein